MTLKEYCWYHDAYLLTSWDHTAQTSAMVHNLLSVVANALGGKKKVQPKEPNAFNPFRQDKVSRTQKVTASTIHVFRHIGNNMIRDK